MKRNTTIRHVLGFDDVLLVPAETALKPSEISTVTQLTRDIKLNIPLVSAPRDHVTESSMAIAMAQLGGLGVIHQNMPAGKQVEEVRRVKRAQGGAVENPITISPETAVAEALDLMTTYKISALPVIDQQKQTVAGIITSRDLRFFEDYAVPVSELMTKNVITARQNTDIATVKKLLHENRVKKIVIVDDQGRCVGLHTVNDIENLSRYPNAARDAKGRLRVGAAVGIGKDSFDRAAAMTDAGLDVVFVDVAHGHNKDIMGLISRIRQQRSSEVQVVAGNVATADAARSLIDAGADAIKVGIGGGQASVSRKHSGIGMPQLQAIIDVVDQASLQNIPVIVDGGVSSPNDIAKAIAAGASAVMLGCGFAGADEAPGDIVYHDGRAYKVVNPAARPQKKATGATGMDVLAFDETAPDTSVPYRGAIQHAVNNIMSGLRSAMAYTGCASIQAFQENAELVRVK